MRFNRHFHGVEIEVLIGRRCILNAKAAIDVYRAHCAQNKQVLTSIEWFLSKRVIWNEVPVILLNRREGALIGVVLMYYSTAYGIPYGLARGGRRGDVSVIAPVADQSRLLEVAAQFLVQFMFAHTVVFTVPYQVPDGITSDLNGLESPMSWFPRDDAHRLNLAGGWDATMQRLSYKLRRNLRYYRRRAAPGTRFVPDLTAAQRREAVSVLSDRGRYPTKLQQARKWDRELQAMPGAFAMGLQSDRGDWLSYIVGWREHTATYIDWQLNDESEATATVMRSYLIEHEAERCSPALFFVGGTTAIWQRACDPAVTTDLIVTGTGPVARLLRSAWQRFRPTADMVLLLQKHRSLAATDIPETTPIKTRSQSWPVPPAAKA